MPKSLLASALIIIALFFSVPTNPDSSQSVDDLHHSPILDLGQEEMDYE